jgi:hypothetical protein
VGNDQTAGSGSPAGGRGRLARVIATRAGRAAPEAPFVIEHGSMPCDGAWPAERIELFQRWIDAGMRP